MFHQSAAREIYHREGDPRVNGYMAIRPGWYSAFQFIPKVFDGVEVRALVQASRVLPHRSRQRIYVCAQVNCHAETGKGLPQTVATKLKAQNHLECNCIL